MKVVIFAGGLGTRMKEETEFRPKPMVEIGGMPVLWHIMKHFSKYGTREFIVLAGYKASYVKDFFINYGKTSLGFTVNTKTGKATFHSALEDWDVTVLDTGVDTPTGGRLLKAREFIGTEPFICTYGDGLSDLRVDKLGEFFEQDPGSSVVSVSPASSRFGRVIMGSSTKVLGFQEKPTLSDPVSIGYFIFTKDVFDFISENTMLEDFALSKLAESNKLRAFWHDGFWLPMDTYREYKQLETLWRNGEAPWA